MQHVARRVVTASTAVVAGAALLLAALRPRRVEVVGESMLPALRPGDRLLVLRLPPSPGDVVAVGDPREPTRTLVKRLAVRARRPVPWVGRAFLVAGDNRQATTDSLDFGPVPARLFRGRAVYRYAPAERTGLVGRAAHIELFRRDHAADGRAVPDGNIE